MRSVLAQALCAATALALAPLADRCATANAQDDPSVLVDTTTLVRGRLPQSVVSYGIARPGPAAQSNVVAQIAAVVSTVHVRVGEAVHANAPLLELTPTPATHAAYSAALAGQRQAADALERTERLLEGSLATGLEVAAAKRADSDARTALAALSAQGAGGPTVLRAPFAAVVTAVMAAPHSIVAEGAPLVSLTRPEGLLLFAGLVPAQASLVKAGDAVHIQPMGNAPGFDGRVALRGALVDPANGLVPVEVKIPEHALLPGETARASIVTGEASGFLVPHAAVLVNDGGGAYLVQVERGAAKLVPIEILATADGQDAVSGRLNPGAPVVTTGNHQLQEGMKVRLRDEAAGSSR